MLPIHNRLQSDTLETARMLLKAITPEMMRVIFTEFTDEDIMQFLGLATSADIETERGKFQQGLTMYRISFRHFLMIDKASNTVLGRIGYHWWHVPHSRAEIGYGIFRDEDKRKGYMKEAIKAVVAYGFNEMKLNRIEAFISPMNEPSLRLVEGLGFTREGILREHYCSGAKIEDSACFSLLRREFEQMTS